MTETLVQLWLLLFSVTAVALSQSARPQLRRWACVFGLLSQPAWFIASWGQFGMFALCFVYTAVWARGAWLFWIRKVPA